MNRFRLLVIVAAVAVLVLALTVTPASADPVETIYNKFFGCEGRFQWPCPGPAL